VHHHRELAAVTFLGQTALQRPYTFVIVSFPVRSIFPWSASLPTAVSRGRFREHITPGHFRSIVAAYPRTEHSQEEIIQNFYEGIKHKPETTFGNVKADVPAGKYPKFQRMNFCNVILGSQWKG
jgi:hypothetical protein